MEAEPTGKLRHYSEADVDKIERACGYLHSKQKAAHKARKLLKTKRKS